MEVCDGGFDQFFLTNQNLTDYALEGLLKIEAIEHYNLLINGKKIHNEQREEFYNLRNPNLDELDEKFYELSKIDVNRQKFLVKNIEMLRSSFCQAEFISASLKIRCRNKFGMTESCCVPLFVKLNLFQLLSKLDAEINSA